MSVETKVKERKMSGVLFVQLPPELKLRFKLACTEAGISMNEIITSFVTNMVEELKPERTVGNDKSLR